MNDKFFEVTGSTPTLSHNGNNESITPWGCLLSQNWVRFYQLCMNGALLKNNCSFDFPRDT